MRRLLVCAGVLSLITLSDGNAQRWKGSNAYCPVGSSECGGSYFDIARESIFSLFLQDLFSVDRGSKKRGASAFIVPGASAAKSDGAVENFVTNDDKPRGAEFSPVEHPPVAQPVRNSWSWAGLPPKFDVWGWPDSERGNGPPNHAAVFDLPAAGLGGGRSDDAHSAAGPSDDLPIGTSDDRPRAFKPDVIGQNNAALAPEPSTLLLISTGLPIAAAILRGRRRR